MQRRQIVISDLAQRDLEKIADWLTSEASLTLATRYVARIRDRLKALEYGAERGTVRSHPARGLRVVGLLRSVSVAFTVDDQSVRIIRIFHGGQDWRAELSEETDEEQS